MTARLELVERLDAALRPDDRVRGLWLTGSMGTGTDDEFSDVDVLVVVRPDDRDAFLEEWPALVARFDPLLVNRLGGAPVFSHVLPGWLRFDAVIGTADDLAELSAAQVRAVFDRDGLRASAPAHRGADPAVVRELTEEFLRVLGLLPVVLGRGELTTAASGAALLRQLLVVLHRYRAEGARLSGALHLSRVLPADVLAALDALPPLHADRAAVVRLHLVCAGMFLPVARELLGDDHPFALEAACWEHLRAHLGPDAG